MKLKLSFIIIIIGIFSFYNNIYAQLTEYSISSPDNKLKLSFAKSKDGSFTYKLFANNELIINSSEIGYKLNNGNKIPDKNWIIEEHNTNHVNSEWKPVWGKRKIVPDIYNELILELSQQNRKNSNKLFFIIRLYNDGLAFKYNFNEKQTSLEEELTEFNFSSNYTAWSYNGENPNIGPEKLSDIDSVRRPVMLISNDDKYYMAIHEADLRAGIPLKLISKKGDYKCKTDISPITLSDENSSAWRVVLFGEKLNTLVDSHLIELLNPEPKMDFSWVKPGIYVWDWRINGAIVNDFTYGMNYQSWIRMVNFAAKYGLKGLVLDANWYGPEHDSNSDPINGGKVKDVQNIIKYANDRNVGIWLYLNDVGGRNYPLEETLELYHKWGAIGVKYGFMKGTEEEKNNRTRMITELCAKYKLLVDFHDGPVHPYGQMRTWPNAITREYCHAQLDAHRVFTPSTFVTSVFVNMLAGPIDMNNGMFDLRQGPTTRIDENKPVPSTIVSEAARTLITFSGATILPDIPEFYEKYPELLSFITAQQMPWKESKTLDGKVGEYIVMMRQTENCYLIGAANNEYKRNLNIGMSFLPEGEYELTLIQDGKDAHYLKNRESYQVSNKIVTKYDNVNITLAEGGGACLILRKKLPNFTNIRNGLYWTNQKIQNGTPITIAFLGGSITEAPGYRIQFEEWFKSTFPNNRTTINAGIGGTGSDLGVVRVEEDVIIKKPDLVFVEFAVNDANADSLQIVRSMEGIVRKIKKQLPKTDICFLYTTNKVQENSILNGEHWRSSRIMESVANYYNIPSVSFDFAVAKYLKEGKLVLHALPGVDYGNKICFTKDGTHPGEEGHRIYTETLCNGFLQMIKNYQKPIKTKEPICNTNYEESKMYNIKDKWLSKYWIRKSNSDSIVRPFREHFKNVIYTNKTGESIQFCFEGTRIGLFDIIGPMGASLNVYIDGKFIKNIRRFDEYCTYNRMSYLWLPEVPIGKHTVRIETDCTQFDKEKILKKKKVINNLNKYEIYIGNILCIGKIVD